jgi:hypothetical protein
MPPKYKGISRIDYKHTHGWYVRVYKNGGVFFSKLCSDRVYGGKQKALRAAFEIRDHNQMVADSKFGKTPTGRPRPGFFSKPNKRNKSGVVGVHFTEKKEFGRKVPCWVATWKEDGKNKSKDFRIHNFENSEEAKQAAISYRRMKEHNLYNVKEYEDAF